MQTIKTLVANQNTYFRAGNTVSLPTRMEYLIDLKQSIMRNEAVIYDALRQDLGKANFETFTTEVYLCLDAILGYQKHGKQWLKTKNVRTSIVSIPSSGKISLMPYGNVLVLSPWNYPFQLAMLPLIDAIACGNTVVLKPSEHAPQTGLVLKKILEEVFPSGYVDVVLGGVEESQMLLDEQFQLIFFTGSTAVGRSVLAQASKHFTPVVLELGGKSPCIVSESAQVEIAAKRIAWGKFLNAGQTCVAPDYVYVHETIKDAFVDALIRYIHQFYYQQGTLNDDYSKIIHERHLNKLLSLIDEKKVAFGGASDAVSQRLEPTILTNVDWKDACMEDEIFGPILPILAYTDFDATMAVIRNHPSPLAFYYFGDSKKEQDYITKQMPFGGGGINEVVMHVADHGLPFGGVGESGMGRYHGKESVRTFTYQKALLIKKTGLELDLKYPPYQSKLVQLKRLFRLLRKL